MFIPITVETNKSGMLKCTISYCSDFNRLEPMQKCTTYDLVAVITHHGNVGGKINLFIGLRQLCPKWTPLAGATNENIVQNHLNIALLNVF